MEHQRKLFQQRGYSEICAENAKPADSENI